MKGYFDSIPEAIEDAARIDGVNDRQLITKIVMPLARPSIIISSVLVVIYVWNEYIFSTVFLSGAEKNTLAVALYSLQATDYTRNWPLFSAAAILTTLPVLILFFLGAEIHGIGTVFGRCQRLKAGGTYDFARSNFTYTAVAVCICEQ